MEIKPILTNLMWVENISYKGLKPHTVMFILHLFSTVMMVKYFSVQVYNSQNHTKLETVGYIKFVKKLYN